MTKTRGRELGLLVISIGVGLTFAEIAVREFLPVPERVRIEPLPIPAAGQGADPGTTQEIPEALRELIINTPTGRRMRPHVLAAIQNFASTTVSTNALGYRNPEIGPKGARRVLFLGDSIAFGQGVREEDTFVRRIETMSRSAGTPMETINAAVPGIGLENELAILLETGLSTNPDDVVLCFYLNDALPSPGVRILPVPRGLEWSRLALHVARSISFLANRSGDELDPREARSWLAELRERYPAKDGDPIRDRPAFNQFMQDAYPDWGSAWTDGAWRRIDPVLAELKRYADLHRFNLWIVCFPVAYQVDAEFVEDTPQRRLGESSQRLRVPYLDLLPILRKAKEASNEPLFRDHCHLRPAGHAVVARAVLDFITVRRAQPAQ